MIPPSFSLPLTYLSLLPCLPTTRLLLSSFPSLLHLFSSTSLLLHSFFLFSHLTHQTYSSTLRKDVSMSFFKKKNETVSHHCLDAYHLCCIKLCEKSEQVGKNSTFENFCFFQGHLRKKRFLSNYLSVHLQFAFQARHNFLLLFFFS